MHQLLLVARSSASSSSSWWKMGKRLSRRTRMSGAMPAAASAAAAAHGRLCRRDRHCRATCDALLTPPASFVARRASSAPHPRAEHTTPPGNPPCAGGSGTRNAPCRAVVQLASRAHLGGQACRSSVPASSVGAGAAVIFDATAGAWPERLKHSGAAKGRPQPWPRPGKR
eukprot:359029-Chlamydomonas_euryale.AAC.4